MVVGLFAAQPTIVSAGDGAGWSWPFRLTNLFSKGGIDLKTHTCNECDPGVECIHRVPVTECVTGKKLVYDSSIRYEYVSIPEVRYRWKKIWVTREIDAEYQKPVCKSEDGQNCFGIEKWDDEDAGCGKLHCRTIDPQLEKAACKHIECETGDTIVKVRYKTCVKVPYTVYRQVRRPICLKEPRYEKVEVPIARHECRGLKCQECDTCGGAGCNSCTP